MGRVYVDSPDEAPEDVTVSEGDRGGYYYETGSGESQTDTEVSSIDELETTELIEDEVELSMTEIDAFHEYKFGDYQAMNSVLRGNDDPMITPEIEESAKKLAETIDESSVEFEEDKTVYRGLDGDIVSQLKENVGETVSLNGITSTTHSPDRAGSFVFSDDEGAVLKIDTDRGLPSYGVSDEFDRSMSTGMGEEVTYPLDEDGWGEEKEVLLGDDWEYEVKGIKSEGETDVIELELVEQ